MNRSVSDRLQAGQAVVLDATQPVTTRMVDAQHLAGAILAGGRVELENAVIAGVLDLTNAAVGGDIHLANCVFQAPVRAAGAVFTRSLRLERCRFHGADFDSARFRAQVALAGSRFAVPPGSAADAPERLCRFNDAQFDDVLDAQDVQFRRGVRASFCRVRFGNSTAFQGCRFFGTLDLSEAQVQGSLWLGLTVLTGEADLSRLRVAGDIKLQEARSGRHSALSLRFADVSGFIDLSRAAMRGTLQLGDVVARRGVSLAFSHFGQGVSAAGLQAAWLDGQGMRVRGDAVFSSLKTDELSMVDIRVWGHVLMSYAEISGCADFSQARIRAGVALDIEGTRISKKAIFDRVRIGGQVDATGLVVGQKLSWVQAITTRTARFAEIDVQRGVFFTGSRFGGDLILRRAALKGDVTACAVVCEGLFDLYGATASRLFLHAGNAPNDHAARLRGGINAAHARLEYVGAPAVEFGTDPASHAPGKRVGSNAEVDFQHCEVREVANFSDAVSYLPISFYGASVGGQFIFQRVKLGAQAPANFLGATFLGLSFFNRVDFAAGADFSYSRFEQTAYFRARFGKAASFDFSRFNAIADFSDTEAGAWASDDALWRDSSRHPAACDFADASFRQCRIQSDAHFDSVVFRGELDLRQATFASLCLPSDDRASSGGRLPATIRLTGCRYDKLNMQDPLALLLSAEGTLRLKNGFARPPFGQLEDCLRRNGNDAGANAVYLARRRCERQGKRGLFWLWDTAYRGLANYGVQPVRLAWISLALVVAGSLFFAQPGTVDPKDKSLRAGGPYTASGEEAVSMAIAEFLPVSLPIKDHLSPAAAPVAVALPGGRSLTVRPTIIASLLQLMGWIVVPIGVAAVSGVLMRKPK
ncbi:hypothetical protein GCM10025771_22020 [Niveibacterium umoris]|uniref:Pentapeptide repeat-containing protein n=1 Tax=Niveibacterium umoris TaxID=1193620 RepID=A0A840BM51_9RHOO|nr:pentapeptide repeat-containing protein [Niveibacterium umoris]MBB4012609.1 hypothetical protein [Niveibacterium umoris]